MRTARKRLDGELCYYHLVNRAAGERTDLLFGAAEKEKLFTLALELSHK